MRANSDCALPNLRRWRSMRYYTSACWKRIRKRGARSRAAGTLTIRDIELIPIIVPLDGVYRGSYYRMENRASLITRVVTEEGIVGEAYAGDEDKTLGDIAGVIRDEIAPRLIGMNAFSYERCWELALSGDLRPAARQANWSCGGRVCRLRDLGRDRQGPWPAPVEAVGWLPRPRAGQHHRWLLRS